MSPSVDVLQVHKRVTSQILTGFDPMDLFGHVRRHRISVPGYPQCDHPVSGVRYHNIPIIIGLILTMYPPPINIEKQPLWMHYRVILLNLRHIPYHRLKGYELRQSQVSPHYPMLPYPPG